MKFGIDFDLKIPRIEILSIRQIPLILSKVFLEDTMKQFRRIAPVWAAVGCSLCGIARADAFDDLKGYDYQNRTAVAAVNQQIDAAQADKAALAGIETKLDSVLTDANATFAGKQEACKFLGQMGSKASVPALTGLLMDEKTANIARYALERIADSSAAKALRTALSQANGKTQIGIVNSLGDRGDAESVPLLRPLMKSDNAELRDATVTALGKIGTPPALAALTGLNDKSLLVSQAILKAADKIAASGNRAEAEKTYLALAGPQNIPVVRSSALRGLAALGSPRAASVALTEMKSADQSVAFAAARIYSGLPEAKKARDISPLATLDAPTKTVLLTGFADNGVSGGAALAAQSLTSDDANLRRAAIRATGKLGGAPAVAKLAEIAAQGTDGDDRRTARQTLIDLTGRDTDAAILGAVKVGNPDIQATLMGVLAERPTVGARTALLGAAQGAEPKVAAEALRALEKSGTAAEYPDIVKVLATATNESVRDAAHNATVAMANRSADRDKAAEPLLAVVNSAPAANRASLLGALAEIGGDRSLDTLTQAAKSTDGEIKTAAITALAETWSDSRPTPTLLTIVKSDGDKTTRIQALRGYLRLVGQDEKLSAEDRVTKVKTALDVAERPEEKRQALGVLRDARTEAAVALAAKYLDVPELFDDAAETILYLAAPQKKNNADLPAIKGDATNAALAKITVLAKDDAMRERVKKLGNSF